MQVKKFEAKTMKEALELVKVHMGPEAIILAAKDSHRGFGLMGEKSVEVTAAVSEETLRKKKVAESKLRGELRERFHQIPAHKQREFINKVFKDRTQVLPATREVEMIGAHARPAPKVSAQARAQTSGMRYADITDEEGGGAPPPKGTSASQERVKRAAERAQRASALLQEEAAQTKAARPVLPPAKAIVPNGVHALESQVRELKALVDRFQHMPQNPLSMHPGAEQGLPFELSPAYQRLTGQGLRPQIVTPLLKRAQNELDPESLKKSALVDAWLVGQMLNTVEVCKTPMHGRYHVFMGSTGQGKTTSLVKFASQLLLKEKRTIAIISLDTIKVGAADQLRIYAQILNVPFAIVRSPEEWAVAEKKLARVQTVLVDCPGFNLRSMEEADWLKRMIPPEPLERTIHYVQSVLARDEEAMDLADRYQMLGFHDVIFTRLDESSRQGLILNMQERFGKPVHSFGLGPRIPEDFEIASKERIIDFLFKLTKIAKRGEF